MNLKIPKSFDIKLVQKMILEEDNFISNIFSKMPLPLTDLDIQRKDNEVECFNDSNGYNCTPLLGKKAKRAQTFEELHSKLNELKGKKKLEYKQKLLKKSLKNKIHKRTKRDERLMQKKLARTENLSAVSKVQDADVQKPKAKPIFNSQGNMVFSKFDFSDIGAKKQHKVEKDPKKILKNLEENKKKIKELEASGEKEKAEELKEKQAWKNALAKTSGEKVKDEPELLKKTIKRKEQQKKQNLKKWDNRIENLKKSKDERQQKRQDNIMKRKKEKKNNKLKKASKKGRIIPGF